jgi:hypothetical protein
MVYEARCHCGAMRLRFRSDEITEGIRCNCSICIRRGAVMSLAYFGPDDIELLEGREGLSLYQFGDRMVNHWTCPTCGIYVFHDVVGKPGWLRLNLGCVEGLDTFALKIKFIDGRAY